MTAHLPHCRGFKTRASQWWACLYPERPPDDDVMYEHRCMSCRVAARSHFVTAGEPTGPWEHTDGDGDTIGMTLAEWTNQFPPPGFEEVPVA